MDFRLGLNHLGRSNTLPILRCRTMSIYEIFRKRFIKTPSATKNDVRYIRVYHRPAGARTEDRLRTSAVPAT